MLESGTSGGDVSVYIHPGELMQEMKGGKADTEVPWLARWRATQDDSA
jgi:hypothetical protein